MTFGKPAEAAHAYVADQLGNQLSGCRCLIQCLATVGNAEERSLESFGTELSGSVDYSLSELDSAVRSSQKRPPIAVLNEAEPAWKFRCPSRVEAATGNLVA